MSPLAATFGSNLILCAALALALGWVVYHRVSTPPRRNPLRELAGPPVHTLFGSHMPSLLEYDLRFIVLYLTHHRSIVRPGPPRPTPSMSRNTVGAYA